MFSYEVYTFAAVIATLLPSHTRAHTHTHTHGTHAGRAPGSFLACGP